jgi:hypothetical protein
MYAVMAAGDAEMSGQAAEPEISIEVARRAVAETVDNAPRAALNTGSRTTGLAA